MRRLDRTQRATRLDALAPVLTIEPSELAAERAGIGLFSPLALFVAGAGGVAAGIVVTRS